MYIPALFCPLIKVKMIKPAWFEMFWELLYEGFKSICDTTNLVAFRPARVARTVNISIYVNMMFSAFSRVVNVSDMRQLCLSP